MCIRDSFPAAAEINTRRYSHFYLFNNPESFFIRIGAESPRVGKNIERAGWLNMNGETYCRQTLQHIAAAFVINRSHRSDIVSCLSQCRDPRPLNKTIGGNHEILMNALHHGGELFGKYAISQAPARHGIQFGKAIDDKSLIRKFQNGMRPSLIDQAVIDFIGDNILPFKLRYMLQLLRAHDDS